VERRLQKLNEQQQKGEELRLLDILRVAFGRTGVPAMIIEAAVPELATCWRILETDQAEPVLAAW
jgi:hypothetical protein